MLISPNMGLKIWNLLTDLFDHTQLENNFAAIDLHNHTNGNGVQIPTGGIADGAVTDPKIATATITDDKIAPATITGDKIAAHTITGDGVPERGYSNIAEDTITDTNVAAANKDGLATTPSMRTLGTGAQQALPGNATPGGPPTGGAGGVLAGSYPNPGLAATVSSPSTDLTVSTVVAGGGNVGIGSGGIIVNGAVAASGNLTGGNIKYGSGAVTIASGNKSAEVQIVHGLGATPASVQVTFHLDTLAAKEGSSGGLIIAVDHFNFPPTSTYFYVYVVANQPMGATNTFHFDWLALA